MKVEIVVIIITFCYFLAFVRKRPLRTRCFRRAGFRPTSNEGKRIRPIDDVIKVRDVTGVEFRRRQNESQQSWKRRATTEFDRIVSGCVTIVDICVWLRSELDRD